MAVVGGGASGIPKPKAPKRKPKPPPNVGRVDAVQKAAMAVQAREKQGATDKQSHLKQVPPNVLAGSIHPNVLAEDPKDPKVLATLVTKSLIYRSVRMTTSPRHHVTTSPTYHVTTSSLNPTLAPVTLITTSPHHHIHRYRHN